MTDREIIDNAYASALTSMFNIFLDGRLGEYGAPEDRFRLGLIGLRAAYKKALEIVGDHDVSAIRN